MLKNILPMGSVGAVDLPAEGELDAAGGEVVADRAGVGHGAGEPVALGGEVLVVGGEAGVADPGLGHGRECTFSPRQSGFSPHGISATPQVKVTVA
jgi:hypothetical protein